jgi:hypothetical protein
MGDLHSQRWAAVADAHLPSISRNLKRIADALEKEDDPLQDPAVQGLLARIEEFEESLALCLADDSPLDDLAKGVVRGFFVVLLNG